MYLYSGEGSAAGRFENEIIIRNRNKWQIARSKISQFSQQQQQNKKRSGLVL
jgi:hypothetical protein